MANYHQSNLIVSIKFKVKTRYSAFTEVLKINVSVAFQIVYTVHVGPAEGDAYQRY